MQPPTLLSLTIDSALRHIAYIADLSAIPDPILLDLFWKTLQAGKLTEKVLKLFMATGNEEILSFVRRLKIKPILTPILPTREDPDMDDLQIHPYVYSKSDMEQTILPARDNIDAFVDAVAQYVTNLQTSTTNPYST